MGAGLSLGGRIWLLVVLCEVRTGVDYNSERQQSRSRYTVPCTEHMNENIAVRSTGATSIGPHVDSQGAQAGEVRSQPPRGRREEKQLPGSEADGRRLWVGPPALWRCLLHSHRFWGHQGLVMDRRGGCAEHQSCLGGRANHRLVVVLLCESVPEAQACPKKA